MAQANGLDGYNLAVLHKYLALPMFQNRVKMDGLFLLPNDNGIVMKGAAITSPDSVTQAGIFPKAPTLDPYEYPVPEHPPFSVLNPVFNTDDIAASPGWALGPSKFRDYCITACNVWNHHLAFPLNERYEATRNTMRVSTDGNLPIPGWTGITYDRDANNGVRFVNLPRDPDTGGIVIAGCGQREMVPFRDDGVEVARLTGTFEILINVNEEVVDRNEAFWVETMVHELAHALGFGFWLDGSLDADAHELSGERYPTALNNLEEITGGDFTDINLEEEGGAGTVNAHWENTERDGQPAVANDIMVGFKAADLTPVITSLTIGQMQDTGYLSLNRPLSRPILRSGLDPAGEIEWIHCIEGQVPHPNEPIYP
jgi:hypothetical protein